MRPSASAAIQTFTVALLKVTAAAEITGGAYHATSGASTSIDLHGIICCMALFRFKRSPVADPLAQSNFEQLEGELPKAIRSVGKSIITTSESTTAASYAIGNLATQDRVSNVVLPTDGLILVSYSATWFVDAAATANAAIFLGANQVRGWAEDSTTLVAQEAVMNTTKVNALTSGQAGLVSTNGAVNSVPGPSTTGQIVGLIKTIGGNPFSYGGFTVIEAGAGTYDVAVEFKTSASTLHAANRKLKVYVAF